MVSSRVLPPRSSEWSSAADGGWGFRPHQVVFRARCRIASRNLCDGAAELYAPATRQEYEPNHGVVRSMMVTNSSCGPRCQTPSWSGKTM